MDRHGNNRQRWLVLPLLVPMAAWLLCSAPVGHVQCLPLYQRFQVDGRSDVDPCNKGKYCVVDTVVANPNNCTTYFVCGASGWNEMPCDANLGFNPETGQCDYMAEVTCQPPCPPFTGPTTTEGPTIAPGLCHYVALPCTAGEKFADVSSCEHYYECVVLNTLRRHQCPAAQVFDIYLSMCNDVTPGFDCDYRCTTTGAPTTLPATTETPNIPPTTTQKVTIRDPCAVVPDCTTEGQHLPDPYSCNSFYVCVNGTNEKEKCPPDTYFDKDGLYCGNFSDITCADCSPVVGTDAPVTAPQVTTPDPCAVAPDCTTEGQQFPDPYSCNSFYVCVNGTNEKEKCPPDTYFDKDGLYCGNFSDIICADCSPVVATEAPSGTTRDPCAVPSDCTPEGQQLPDPYACNSFYVCVNGTNEKENCPQDTYFDKDGLYCGNFSDITCADCSPVVATEAPA